MIDVELYDFSNRRDYYFGLGDNCFLSHNNKTYVLIGEDKDVNFDYCKENDIQVIDIGHRGGTLVLTDSAIGFAHIGKDFGNRFSNLIVANLVVFLNSKGLNAKFDGNDILVDGYKVSSMGKAIVKDKTYFTLQISMHNDIDLIRKICLKPMIKPPKGLSDFGLDREEIVNFIKLFVDNYNQGNIK